MGVALRITQAAPAPQGGEGRHSSSDERETQPRVPIIGLDSGCIPGTRPGSSAKELDRNTRDLQAAGKELVRRKLAAARGRAH